MQDFSKQAMIQFIEYVGEKHLVKPSAARNWKTASSQFLALLDNNEALDLRNLDIEHLGERYAHSKGNKVKPDSIRLYLARFRSAHENFLQYAEDKLNYRPATSTRNRTTIKKGKSNHAEPNKTPSHEGVVKQSTSTPTHTVVTSDGFDFPVPISDGRVVIISNLPRELKGSDADKISAVIKALAMPEPKN